MKKIILLGVLIIQLCGFDPTIAQECDSGKVWVWGMATSGCVIEDGCYTPEKSKELRNFIYGCMCEETSSAGFWWNDSLWEGYSEDHKWEDGCCIETYWYYKDGEKTQLTKTQYDSMRINNGR